MEILENIAVAFSLLVNFDPYVWSIILLSLQISATAMLFAVPLALIIASLIAFRDFFAKQLVLAIFHALLALPTVVVGLILFVLLSRAGPLSSWQWLFTPKAMILGQFIIVLPLLVVYLHSALNANDKLIDEFAFSLHAKWYRKLWLHVFEAKAGIVSGIITGYSRIISEVGCALLVGGNIVGQTRNITSAIALQTAKGEFNAGISLGLVLLLIAVLLSLGLFFLGGKQLGSKRFVTR